MHIALFDLYSSGHHVQYLDYLVRHWIATIEGHRLDVVVPASLLAKAPAFHALCSTGAEAGVRLVSTTTEPDFSAGGLLHADVAHGQALKTYIEQYAPDHVVCLYFDHVQLSLARRLSWTPPTTVSGIYFRPSFHYRHFPGDAPSWKERVQRLRKWLVLKAALRHPKLSALFSLDPAVVPEVQRMASNTRIYALPDGVAPEAEGGPTVEAVVDRAGIESGRYRALIFGALDGRKGIYTVLESLPLLSPEVQQRLCIWLAGRADAGERDRLHAAVQHALQATAVQVVLDDRRLDDDEIQPHMRAADLVLVTYQGHIGSSNVLIRAARAGTPVLSAQYGLLGYQARQHELGWVVDETDPAAIAKALDRAVRHPEEISFNTDLAQAFAKANTAEAFAHMLFDAVLAAPR
ncbi:MAG: hypothetical protein RhofKO_26870 [Rhodothermales bacterium]